MRGLEGKTAIVTGGSSGIGQAIAIRLSEEGMNVGVNYVGRPEGAEATKETPGVWGHPGPADTERSGVPCQLAEPERDRHIPELRGALP